MVYITDELITISLGDFMVTWRAFEELRRAEQ